MKFIKTVLLTLSLVPYVAWSSSQLEREINSAMAHMELKESVAPTKLVSFENGVSTYTKDNGIDLWIANGETKNIGLAALPKTSKESNIVFQEVKDGGHRAIIHVASPTDPIYYEFKVLEASRLILEENGSVEALDQKDATLAVFKAPWAKDANGLNVPTYFTVDGTKLVQVVEHQNNQFSYGIIADPFWVPAGVALRACMAHPVCREVAKQGTKAAIKWAMDKLF